jgi:tetratricopeptide (TPR) repeat protein
MHRTVASGLLAMTLVAFGPAGVMAQPTSPSRPPVQPSPTPKPTAPRPAPARPAAGSAKFDALVADAGKAREARQLERAVELYRQALVIRPSWDEGHWNLATSLYELERFEQARESFRRVLTANPENGTALALRGLCEFRLKNYDAALDDLLKSRLLPINGKDVADVARYHSAILLTRVGQFDQALMVLNDFGTEGNEAPSIIEAMGLAVLRQPMLPTDLPGQRRELILLAGRARYFQAARLMAAARNAFELLVLRYPDTPNVHYAYGVFLLAEEPDKAIEVFQRELKVSPQHVYAKLQIAFAYIRKGEYEQAVRWARDGAAEAPTDYVARNAYGQALLETGDAAGAIEQLETGTKLAPDSPIMYFTLAKAYRRAGRAADADRAQREFVRLNNSLRETRTGSESVGGIPIDAAPGVRTP